MTQEALYIRCSTDGCETIAYYQKRCLCKIHYLRWYYRANKETAAAKASEYYRRNSEKAKQRAKAHYDTTPPEVRQAQRAAWIENNHERHLASHRQNQARRRARKNGADARRFVDQDWQRVVRRFGGRCAYCGAGGAMTIDHVVPLARGGRHTEGNIVPACLSCNTSKGARLLVEWRQRRHSRRPLCPST
jgi:5-methylcytosine-specific restriction endonuclease McrA